MTIILKEIRSELTQKYQYDMDEFLKTVSIMIFVTLFAHAALLAFHNKFRIKKLLWYLDIFKKENKISDKGYDLLYNRYTGFFHYLEFYPDRDDFKVLYENRDFDTYVRMSRWKIRYCSMVIAVSFLLLVLILLINEQ